MTEGSEQRPVEGHGWTSVTSARRTLLVLMLAALAVVLWVFRPLAVALFLATVLAGALWPLQRRLSAAFGGRGTLSAALLLVGVVVLLLAPLVALSAFIVKEATEAFAFLSTTLRNDGVTGLLAHLPDPIEKLVRQGMDRLPSSTDAGLESTVQEQVSARGGKAVAAVGALLTGAGAFAFQAAMMLIALFFFLTEKHRILQWIDDASPLAAGQTHELLAEFRNVNVAVLRSSVLTAGVQTIAAVAGYLLARVPHPFFFAALTFFVALIPAIGAAAVCLLASGVLLVTGHPIAAAFLAGWGVLVVGLSDNLVKPILIRRGGGVAMHGAVVFFALLGGLAAFGTVGLLIGPLSVALFIAMLRIYRRDYGDGGGAARRLVEGGSPRTTTNARVLVPSGTPT